MRDGIVELVRAELGSEFTQIHGQPKSTAMLTLTECDEWDRLPPVSKHSVVVELAVAHFGGPPVLRLHVLGDVREREVVVQAIGVGVRHGRTSTLSASREAMAR
jgi:hypothetical protein